MNIDICIKEWIIDKLNEYEGEIDCDLNFNLWERENIDGSITYDAYKAQEWIGEYFNDLADYVEDYKREYGDYPVYPFGKPEEFMLTMVIFITGYILGDVEGKTKEEIIEELKC